MNRRNLIPLSCPNCGAHMQSETNAKRVLCQYCGQTFDVAQSANGGRGRGGKSTQGAVLGVSVGFAILGAAVSLVVVSKSGSKGGATGELSIPGVTSPGSATHGVMWDTVGGPPIPTRIGAGEAFVGRLRAQGSDLISIAAFDATKIHMLWQTPALGTYSEGYQSTFMAIAGHDVVVTDYRAIVHVYDLATGKELRTMKLSDRAKDLCAAPDGAAKVFIGVTDKNDVLVDADAGTVTPASRPAWCPGSVFGMNNDCRGWLSRGAPRPNCKGGDLSPKVGGFGAKNTMVSGDVGVALGIKEPGTAVPVAVGFDPATKAVRWQQAVASGDQADVETNTTISLMDELVGGRFVTPYSRTSKGWFLTAFDARTGQRLWDVPLQPMIGVSYPEGFSLSETRVYVMRTSSLEVYDAATGKLVGIVGLP